MHVARQGLALVAHLAGESDVSLLGMVPPITRDDERWADRWLQAHGYAHGDRLIAVHPGAGGNAKLWLTSHWVAVIDELMRRGWRVIVTGGMGERAMVEAITRRTAKRPLLLVGEASIGELAALYARCDLVLGVDSGPLHLATATGTPTLALFGPIDHERFGPWGPDERHKVVRSGLWCSPCGAVDACPRGTQPAECMTTITIAQVLAAFDAMAQGETVNAKTQRRRGKRLTQRRKDAEEER
jgi:ADP-heptose:LPS heptosyltransferase